MLCSPAEIEKKRQEALQKLARRGLSPNKPDLFVQPSNYESPKRNLSSPGSSYNFKSMPQKSSSNFINHGQKPYEKPDVQKSNETKQSKKTCVDFYGPNKTVTLKAMLISNEKFQVTMSAYCDGAINIFKEIPSKHYDPKSRNWSFHIADYNYMISKLAVLKSQNVKIEELPNFVVNCLQKPINNCDIDMNRLDTELGQALLPFQLEGLRFGIERNGRCLIADDMGLGKTFQALAIMNYYMNDWPLLIVTTASMKQVWEDTILKYLPSIPTLQVQYMSSSRDYIGGANILIVSHDLMSRSYDKLQERNFGCIIIDESHNLKNPKAKITQVATKLSKVAKRVVLLSGTPALSRPSELFSQLNLLDDKFFGSFFSYATRYCDLHKTHFGYDSSGKSNLQELEIILNKKFMIRRTKDEVMKCVPKKTQEIIRLDVKLQNFSESERKTLQTLYDRYTNTEKSKDKHSLLLTFFSETGKIKIPSVCSYISTLLDKERKFLVFAHHLVVLDAIEVVLKNQNKKYIRIDGNTTSDQRKYFVDTFQTDDRYICAILSITAANAGITLTAAQLVVFAELHWNPSILSQAEARAHRIGQENTVVIQYLLAKGTADDSIWPMLQSKQKILNEVGLCKSSFENISEKRQQSKHTIRSAGMLKSWLSPENKNKDSNESDKNIDNFDCVFNDEFDDILSNMDI